MESRSDDISAAAGLLDARFCEAMRKVIEPRVGRRWVKRSWRGGIVFYFILPSAEGRYR